MRARRSEAESRADEAAAGERDWLDRANALSCTREGHANAAVCRHAGAEPVEALDNVGTNAQWCQGPNRKSSYHLW